MESVFFLCKYLFLVYVIICMFAFDAQHMLVVLFFMNIVMHSESIKYILMTKALCKALCTPGVN